ncbi:hypothetical protein OH807_03280 [Kitasatospora sp. NBC_01560]|uniref:HAAS signaling domain-containing protein n=1 Tax=Kitasatospora sp. NBC_01560 TaxID=2975965 RepID=UPI00386451C3
MNEPLSHPLVRTYLTAVEDRTAALPVARRRELLADLREHVEVALAESGTLDDDAVRRVLGQLGAPAEIAAAALAEEPGDRPVPESSRRTLVTLGLVVLAMPAAFVPAVGPFLGAVVAIAALVRLWRSPQWAGPEKRTATLLMLSPVVTLPVLAVLLSVLLGGLSAAALTVALPVALCLPVVAAVRLGRSAAGLRGRAA